MENENKNFYSSENCVSEFTLADSNENRLED